MNFKCKTCGYKFEAEPEENAVLCPLCGAELNAAECEIAAGEQPARSELKPRSNAKAIIDWAIFGAGFAVFIIIMYAIVSFIVKR